VVCTDGAFARRYALNLRPQLIRALRRATVEGMGRTSVVLACLVLASFSIGSAGCAQLYGGKPERLKNPEKKRKPPEPPEQEVKIVYVDDCAADFRGDPTKVSRQGSMSNQLTGEGETALVSGDKAKDPKAQEEFYKLGISKLSNALQKDPYNHDATLALALAYDKVQRKGCALALLKRIAQLEANAAKFGRGPKALADRVTDTPQWFKGYRKDAIAALGR
jgi:hypothetical protein